MKTLTKLFVLALFTAVCGAKTYPFSVTPGGVTADHVLTHDEQRYIGMEFAGKLMWTDHKIVLHKGEPMAGTRRARCGNPTAEVLPPGAETVPHGLSFVVPLMESPLPDISDESVRDYPEFSAWPPKPVETAGNFAPLPIELLPTGPFVCRKGLDAKQCKSIPVNSTPTPEPKTWIMYVIAFFGYLVSKERSYTLIKGEQNERK